MQCPPSRLEVWVDACNCDLEIMEVAIKAPRHDTRAAVHVTNWRFSFSENCDSALSSELALGRDNVLIKKNKFRQMIDISYIRKNNSRLIK